MPGYIAPSWSKESSFDLPKSPYDWSLNPIVLSHPIFSPWLQTPRSEVDAWIRICSLVKSSSKHGGYGRSLGQYRTISEERTTSLTMRLPSDIFVYVCIFPDLSSMSFPRGFPICRSQRGLQVELSGEPAACTHRRAISRQKLDHERSMEIPPKGEAAKPHENHMFSFCSSYMVCGLWMFMDVYGCLFMLIHRMPWQSHWTCNGDE